MIEAILMKLGRAPATQTILTGMAHAILHAYTCPDDVSGAAGVARARKEPGAVAAGLRARSHRAPARARGGGNATPDVRGVRSLRTAVGQSAARDRAPARA